MDLRKHGLKFLIFSFLFFSFIVLKFSAQSVTGRKSEGSSDRDWIEFPISTFPRIAAERAPFETGEACFLGGIGGGRNGNGAR